LRERDESFCGLDGRLFLCSSAASEKALKIFNDEGLFLILPKSLDVAKFGLPVALAGGNNPDSLLLTG